MLKARLQSSRPVRPIQRPVLDGFRDVFALKVGIPFQIGNGAGDFQDAVVGAGAQALLLHGSLQQALAVGVQLTVCSDLARAHLGVCVDFLSGAGEAVELYLASADYPVSDLGGAFCVAVTAA